MADIALFYESIEYLKEARSCTMLDTHVHGLGYRCCLGKFVSASPPTPLYVVLVESLHVRKLFSEGDIIVNERTKLLRSAVKRNLEMCM